MTVRIDITNTVYNTQMNHIVAQKYSRQGRFDFSAATLALSLLGGRFCANCSLNFYGVVDEIFNDLEQTRRCSRSRLDSLELTTWKSKISERKEISERLYSFMGNYDDFITAF